jgi:hypothetical protein
MYVGSEGQTIPAVNQYYDKKVPGFRLSLHLILNYEFLVNSNVSKPSYNDKYNYQIVFMDNSAGGMCPHRLPVGIP